VLAGKLLYQDSGAAAYHQLNRVRELKSLRKRAKLLGLDLVDHATGEVLVNPVFLGACAQMVAFNSSGVGTLVSQHRLRT